MCKSVMSRSYATWRSHIAGLCCGNFMEISSSEPYMIYKPNLIVKKLDIATKRASGRVKNRGSWWVIVSSKNFNNLLTTLHKYTPYKNNEPE